MVNPVSQRQVLAGVGLPAMLSYGGRQLLLEESLRLLPRRRHVLLCKEVDTGRRLVLKLFAEDERREWQRESSNLVELQRRKVPVATLVAVMEDGCPGLLMEYLPGTTADALLAEADPETAANTIEKLLSFVVGLHQAGCLQKDIHPGNFLFWDAGITLLDAASVQLGPVAMLPLKQRRDNLMLMLAQFYPSQLQALQRLPLALSAFGDANPPAEQLPDLLYASRARRYRHFLKKTGRDCTAFAAVRAADCRGIARRDCAEACRALLDANIDEVMATGQVLKAGNSATVVAVQWQGRDWVIKRYNIKSAWQGIKRQWGQTRAENSWQAANWLELIGIATPRPVAMLQRHQGLMRREAYFICEQLQAPDLLEISEEHCAREGVFTALADFLCLMQELRFSHGDMKGTNFKWHDGKLWVLDLDAVRLMLSPRRQRYWLDKDRRRAMANWPDNPDLAALLSSAQDPG